MLAAKILVVFAVLEYSTNVFGISFKAINSGLEGIRRNRCWQLRRSRANEQFPWYCKPSHVMVIYVNAGTRWVSTTNRFAYTGAVQQNTDVKFVTEQDGGGQIHADFNGATLECDGFSSMKQKTCTIPRHLRPWTGTITVQILGGPSTSFRMSGKPYCPTPGFTGFNCNLDINECEVHKDKAICSWKQGCVNTYGSYRCNCPTGYTISSTDFRYCNKDIPKISSPPDDYTVVFFQTATLRCRHSAKGPVIIQWQINKRVIAVKQMNGEKQTVSPRLTLHDDGDLSIKNVTYYDAGKFTCIVHNTRFFDAVIHNLNIESAGAVSDIPKILSPPSNYTVMLYQTATLHCRYNASSPVIIKWQTNNKVVAIRRLNGTKQTGDVLMTLHNNGDLSITNVTYGYTGKFVCIVQSAYIGAYLVHNLNIESTPVMETHYLVNGTYTDSHVYRIGDDVIIDCLMVAMPVPTVTWNNGQQKITTTATTKVILGNLPNSPVKLPGALKLQLRIMGVTQADAGNYTCTARNRHGVTTKTMKLIVTQ